MWGSSCHDSYNDSVFKYHVDLSNLLVRMDGHFSLDVQLTQFFVQHL